MTDLARQPAVLAIAWTLVHFIWQGAALALAAVVCRRFVSNPRTRYVIGVAALGAMVASAGATFVRERGVAMSSRGPLRMLTGTTTAPGSVSAGNVAVAGPAFVEPAGSTEREEPQPAGSLRRHPLDAPVVTATLVMLWAAGVLVCSLRLATGWLTVRRLISRASPVASPLADRVRQLMTRLGLAGPLPMFASPAAAVPMIVGWIKPILLLPAASLAGLSMAQLDGLIAHELAHIRRHDAFVNGLQAVAEALLFYHPAVWWISRQIREDRERCCDDVAVEICGDALVYATALADLASASRRPRLALAAADGALLNRVRRVLGEPTPDSAGVGWVSFLIALVVAGALVPARATSPSDIRRHDVLLPNVEKAPLSPAAPAVVIAPAAAAAANVSPAQQPARNLFRVRVVDGVTGEPLENVEVGVRCFDALQTRFTNTGMQYTNTAGEFVFDALEPGVCIVMNALKPGFGQRLMENTRPNEIGAGETLRIIKIWQRSSVAGSVLDERRQPIANTPVWLEGYRVLTDEQGRYAFPSLAGSTDSFPALHWTYSVSVPDIELAQPAPSIVLAPGEHRTGVDLVGTRRPRAELSGRVTDQSGTPIVDLSLYLDRGDSPDSQPVTAAVVESDSDGRFRFPDVPRGQYRVRADSMATARPPASLAPVTIPTFWALVPATLDRDVTDFSVVARSMPQIRGAVRFEGHPTYPGLSVLIGVDGLDGFGGRVTTGGNIRVDTEGRFSVGGLRPARYIIRSAGAPGGWQIESAMTGGRDVSSLPLDLTTSTSVDDLVVTLTQRHTNIEGVVRTSQGEVDREASVIVFAADPQLRNGRHVAVRTAGARGVYGISGLAPGDYFIAAVSSDTTGLSLQGADAALLQRLVPLAARIRLDYDVGVARDLTRVTP